MAIDFNELEDLEYGDVFHWDAPEYCDAYIMEATYKGRKATDDELDEINDNQDFVYEKLVDYLY